MIVKEGLKHHGTAERHVRLFYTALMIGFFFIEHMNRPLHLYILELFTPYLFQDSEGQIKNIQVQRSVVQCLKPSKRLAQCKRLEEINTLSAIKIQSSLLDCRDVYSSPFYIEKLRQFSSNYENIKADADTN